MGKRNRSATELYHDRVANIYDGMYSGSQYWDFYWTITWRHIKKFLPAKIPSRALDVGCGTGRWGLKLLKSGFHADFLDISEKMLGQVGHKLGDIKTNYTPQLIHASIDDLSSIGDDTYDFIIGQGDPLCCSENPKKALQEMVRILAPEGVIVMSVDNRHAGYDYFLEQKNFDGLEKFIKNGKTVWLTDKKEERFTVSMFTAEEITKMYAQNNLDVLSLIGKTILPIRELERKDKNLLEDKKAYNRLMKIEESLNSNPSALGRAAHLEIIGRKK